MTIDGINEEHILAYPLTLVMDVERNLLSRVNTGKFSLYNLNAATRKDLQIDRTLGFAEYRAVQLSAGYESQTTRPIVFKGNIKTAYSDRQGPNIITQVEGFDGGFAVTNGFSSITKPKGWNLQDAVRTLVADLPRVSLGTVSPVVVQNSRGVTFNGNTWAQLQRLATPNGATAFIDKEVANFLLRDDVVATSDGIFVIQPSTGLVGIPRRMGNFTFCTTLLEPRAQLGRLIVLNSELNPGANGSYKVVGYHHYGTMSGAIGGECRTDWSLAKTGAPL